MPCPKTPNLLTEYFDDELSELARSELERHISECRYCADELNALQQVQAGLKNWRTEKTPHWDRGVSLYRQEHDDSNRAPVRHWWTTWAPTAASACMLVLLLFNVNVARNSDGVTISFGNQSAATIREELAAFSAEQLALQEHALQLFVTRMDERQDSNNLRLMQAVLDQTQQLSEDNFREIYAYFERQRLFDMENLQVSYQHLLDSDFQTLSAMEEMASFIQFQGEVR